MKTIRSAALLSALIIACGSSGEPAPSSGMGGTMDAGVDASTVDAHLDANQVAPDREASTRDSEAPNDSGFAPEAAVEAAFDSGDAGTQPMDASSSETAATVDAADAADAGPRVDPAHAEPTAAILTAQGTDCLPCAERNGCLDPAQQGGSCEDTAGTAPPACSAILGSSSDVSETEVCRATLNTVFSSGCAATTDGQTPCLCGDTEPLACLAGDASATGAALPLYQCDFGFSEMGAIIANFTNQAFGTGQANALVQCLASWSCDCFGSQ